MKIEEHMMAIVLAALVLGTFAFNIYAQGEVNSSLQTQQAQISAIKLQQQTSAPVAATSQNAQQGATISFQEFLPKGIPEIYGAELGVSFDKPVESLAILSALDGDLYPNGKIKFAELTEQAKQDYIKLGMSIACEYCCGAKSLIAPNGQPACGCAHSAAMRGLAKYMLKNHYGEMSNEQLLEEMTNWKTMFFPKQMYTKALELQASGGSITPDVLEQVPDMVGGC